MTEIEVLQKEVSNQWAECYEFYYNTLTGEEREMVEAEDIMEKMENGHYHTYTPPHQSETLCEFCELYRQAWIVQENTEIRLNELRLDVENSSDSYHHEYYREN